MRLFIIYRQASSCCVLHKYSQEDMEVCGIATSSKTLSIVKVYLCSRLFKLRIFFHCQLKILQLCDQLNEYNSSTEAIPSWLSNL